MKINVTRKHIRNGIQMSASDCPVALAVKEHFPDKYVGVTYGDIRIGEGCYAGEYTSYATPKHVQEFMYQFDNTISFWYSSFWRWWYIKPFSFELNI